jgi:hypothetical protein
MRVCFVDGCLSFYSFILAIVLSVLLSFGHCLVCSSVFWPLSCLFFKNRQDNGQKTEEQTRQWPKDRRTDKTMAKIKE